MQARFDELTEKGIKVVGVSMDDTEVQKEFHTEHGFPFPLVPDSEGELVGAFGVKLLRPGICARESFLVRGGKVVWADRSAKPADHGAVVIAAFDALE